MSADPKAVDVLGIIDALVDNYDYGGSLTKAEADEASAAVAELIASGNELQFIRNNGCPAEAFDAAVARHDAALARSKGGQS